MAFLCPDCSNPSLKIIKSLECSPDAVWDEVSLQIILCSKCGFEGAALYRESRRGASETAYHTGFRLSEENLGMVRYAVQSGNPLDYNELFREGGGKNFPNFEIEYRPGDEE